MVNEREEIRRQVREIVGNRPVGCLRRSLFRAARAHPPPLGLLSKLYDEKRLALLVLFHTPENTDRYYAWVREEHAAEMAGAT